MAAERPELSWSLSQPAAIPSRSLRGEEPGRQRGWTRPARRSAPKARLVDDEPVASTQHSDEVRHGTASERRSEANELGTSPRGEERRVHREVRAGEENARYEVVAVRP